MSVDDSQAQSRRAQAGKILEDVCSFILNSTLIGEDIYVVSGEEANLRSVIGRPDIVKEIIDFNKLPIKRPCDQKQLEDYPDLETITKKPRT